MCKFQLLGEKLLLPADFVLSLGEKQCFSKGVCQYSSVFCDCHLMLLGGLKEEMLFLRVRQQVICQT